MLHMQPVSKKGEQVHVTAVTIDHVLQLKLMHACVTHGRYYMPAATDGVLNNKLPKPNTVTQNNALLRVAAVAYTWDDGAFDAQSPAVLGELDELLHIIKQLSDDDLRTSLHLHSSEWQ